MKNFEISKLIHDNLELIPHRLVHLFIVEAIQIDLNYGCLTVACDIGRKVNWNIQCLANLFQAFVHLGDYLMYPVRSLQFSLVKIR